MQDVGSGTEVGARDRDGYLMDVGKKCFWLVLVSSGKFWLVLASYGSKGDNSLFKNVEILEIHQKFAEIGRFECGNVPGNPKIADVVDFPLHFLYKRKGKSIRSNDLGFSGTFPHSNRPISANF